MGGRGVIGDKWSMRILWACAIGSAVGLYMVAVQRQQQNRDRMMAESLKAMESEASGESALDVDCNDLLKSFLDISDWRDVFSSGNNVFVVEF